jgi:uncharacterized protein YeaO (DUF488 family)
VRLKAARFGEADGGANIIRLKRAYEDASPADGERVLVERLWPRGVTKLQAALDLWLKDVAPSPELRRWFGHDPAKWERFEQRYWNELRGREEAVDVLRRKTKRGTVTLVYSARDEEHNGAVALKEFLEHEKGRTSAKARNRHRKVEEPDDSGTRR